MTDFQLNGSIKEAAHTLADGLKAVAAAIENHAVATLAASANNPSHHHFDYSTRQASNALDRAKRGGI